MRPAQVDVLAEPDFAAGLALIESTYDLVEALPLVGLAVRVKRGPASEAGDPTARAAFASICGTRPAPPRRCWTYTLRTDA